MNIHPSFVPSILVAGLLCSIAQGARAETKHVPIQSDPAQLGEPSLVLDDLLLETTPGVDFAWSTPGGQYTDPSSLFSVHGYVDGVFAGASKDWTAPDPSRLSAPGQLLVPNTADSSFQFDAALIFSSELTDRHRLMLETHLVSDPSGTGAAGPGGVTLALTEATVAWDILQTHLTLSSGIYWAPFGIVNQDWLGAQARFTLVPRAANAFPAHYNERGLRLNGSVAFNEHTGINYVLSIGNGVQSFGIDGQSAFDANASRSAIFRLGLFPGLGDALEVGYSGFVGKLRDEFDPDLPLSEPKRYASDVIAHGADLQFHLKKFELRSYYIFSSETLEGEESLSPSPLKRHGFMLEGLYDIPLDNEWVSGLAPKLRLDWTQLDLLSDDGRNSSDSAALVYSAGVNFYPGGQTLTFKSYPQRNVYISLEYHFQRELGRPQLDNNRFVGRFTGRF